MRLKLLSIFALVGLNCLAFPKATVADSFDWTFVTNGVIGSGTLVASPVNGTDYDLVTSITGTIEGQAITGLLVPGTYLLNDNFIYPEENGGNAPFANGFVDDFGISFSSATLDWNIDFFEDQCGSVACLGPAYGVVSGLFNIGVGTGGTFTLAPASAPEPGAISLLLSGLLGFGLLAVMRRRHFRSV